MPHIFVSHATADDDTVTRIHDQLEAATGHDLWVDHKDIPKSGVNWQDAIDNALRDSDALLLVLSKNGVNRPEITSEWRDALFRNNTVYLAVIDDVSPLDIPARLRILTWVELHKDWDGGINALAAAILGKTIAPDAPVVMHRPITGRIDRRLLTIPLAGRDADAAAIKNLLKRGPTAILGVGGLGKSRLAAELVVKSEDVGGAIWHNVSELSRPDEVLELLREHFNLEATASRRDTLARLKTYKRLIVLDNAESVPEDDPRRAQYVELVDDLIAHDAQVLLTSRVKWGDVKLAQNHAPNTLPLDSAALVVLNMAEVMNVPGLESHANAIAEAARFHPRLIEWAVGQMTMFDPEKVIRDLKSLKSAEVQAALDEMILKTLRQMTDARGTEPEAALRKLNVCRGGFTYPAAAAILGIDLESPDADVGTRYIVSAPSSSPRPEGEGSGVRVFSPDSLDSWLTTLQTWRFVTYDPARRRYSIDPLVIAAVTEDDTAHKPHYDYYHALAEKHNNRQDYVGLDPESINVDVAFERCIGKNNPIDALLIYFATSDFLTNRGRFEQQKVWLEHLRSILSAEANPILRAGVQQALGMVYVDNPLMEPNVRFRLAIDAFTAALNYFTVERSAGNYAEIQNNLGIAYWKLASLEDGKGNLRRAITAYEAALVYRTAVAAPLNYAITQSNLGNAYTSLATLEDREANLRRAITAFETALDYYSRTAAPLDYAMTKNSLGVAYSDLAALEDRDANLRRAIAAYQAALVYQTPAAAPRDYAQTQRNLGLAYQDLGDIPSAIICWREAEKYYRQMGYIEDADLMLRWLTDAEGKLGGGES
jgi:tetratricopeptide (TPR) repeat protein